MSETTSPNAGVPGDEDIFAVAGEPAVDQAYLASGSDWAQVIESQRERADEIIVVNMGPQHPSTHGVMRLVLEMDGETVMSCRPGIGFLHTGIEKNAEYRTWTQGSTFFTRCNYVAGIHNEAAYSMAVDKLLGITDDIPRRGQDLRVLMLEVNRLASHLTAVGACGLELGATSVQEVGLRERERVLEFTEAVTGLRMNNAYIRPGGVENDLPDDGIDLLDEFIKQLKINLPELGQFTLTNPIFKGRLQGVAHMDLAACMMMGATGPVLRATGYPWDLRKTQPYLTYDQYDFDVPVETTCDAYGRFRIRLNEMEQSVRVLEQVRDSLAKSTGEPYRVQDPDLEWPSDLTVGPDGQGNSNEHIKHIMGESMEALIHHFKKVTQGFKVPAGEVYAAIEGPGGELGCHVVSDGGTRPYRAHLRDPGFTHVQSLPLMSEGAMLSDLVMAVASIDPVMGGVDR
ncbi:NADH-quinone oxidoreductase subunit D [Brooklawnia cerclae]|uniref:NADH-quinone oxidoreductase subunit D n=1 Tax=Brooklawnia cerclae TaxID=349934 RepID=A0ABX0SBN4_9ACTN|nr:NADH-quinone oxidoreductase subunit D [Brooklawnia cerclae]NIH55782.1 NADH-quinone oxidoreductase subunit D [Brooklawnia cerclae]